ncbi:MAG: PAS domain-containing protein [Planctomycetota bacterium]
MSDREPASGVFSRTRLEAEPVARRASPRGWWGPAGLAGLFVVVWCVLLWFAGPWGWGWGMIALALLCVALACGMAWGMWSLKRDIDQRQQTEAALRASERRFPLLAENIPGVVYLCRNDRRYTMRYLNDAVEVLTGYPKEEFLEDRVSFADLYHPDDAPNVYGQVDQALAEKRPFHLVYRIKHRSGEWRWVEEFGTGVFEEESGELLFLEGFLSNITERRGAEEALRESRQMLQLVLDTIPARVFWKDRNSVYIGCNQLFAKDAGLRLADEIPGKTDYDLAWKQEETEFYRECDRRVMGADQPEYHIIEPELQADGTHAWLDTNKIPLHDAEGKVVGILGTYEDITERKRAEEQLLRERRLFMGGPVVVFRWVAARGWPVEYVSPNVACLLGYTAEDFMSGRVLYAAIIHPDDLERIAEEVARHSREAVPCFEQDYRIIRPDGGVRWLYDFTVVARNEQAQITHYEGYVLDVTERRRAEEEQRRLEARIQQAQKLESLGILAGGIAHDFNNLLVGILGNAGLALMELAPESAARQTIRQIETAAQRAADLTRQMLAYSGKGRFIVEPLDLSKVVEEMAHLLQVSISKKAVLRFNLARDLAAIRADATQVRQVVMNLITNASDAVGDCSGVIAVSTGVRKADRAYLSETRLHDDLPEGYYAYVEVADTGCGMDAETVSKIFDPFFTTKFSGRGLGLSAILGIMRGHKGTLKVDTRAGGGTTFTVLFPCVGTPGEGTSGAPGEEATSEKATTEQEWRGTGTILVVDDEEAVRTVARMTLERFGFTVLTAADGRQALEVFQRHADEIAAVLLDMTMPQLSGEEVLRELRRVRPKVPVVLSSGYNEEDAISQFIGEELAGFVQKPYRPRELVEKLRAILEA